MREQVVIFDPNYQYISFHGVSNIDDLIDAMTAEKMVVRYSPQSFSPEEEFNSFADIVWEFRNYALIIDECSVVQSAGGINKRLERFIRQAPDDVVIIQTTHRPVDTNKLSRQLSTDVFAFQTRMKADLDMMRSDFFPDMPEIVQELPNYHVLHYWAGEGGSYQWQVWDNPEEWYVRIGTERNIRRDSRALEIEPQPAA